MNNLKLIATITLDFYTNNIKTINVKQCDTNSRFILVSFTEHGKKVTLNKDTMSVITRYKKADGKFGLRDCNILEDGTVLIETNEQMLAVAGRCRLDIVILEAKGLKVVDYCDVTSLEDINCPVLSTMPLDLNVIASPISKDELESKYDFTALNMALAETKAAEADMIAKNKAWEASELERRKNENDRIKAEEVREENVDNTIKKCQSDVANTINVCNESVQSAVSKATTATTAATTAAQNATTATTNANIAATNANLEAQNCKEVYEKVRTDTDDIIGECETARDRANTAAQECESIVDFTGVVMKSEKGVAGGVAALDADGKVPNEQLPDYSICPDWNQTDSAAKDYIKNKIPVKNGTGVNSIVIGEGNAEGDFSFTGGTTDTTIAKEMFGSIIGTLIGQPDAAYSKGDMSFAYGAGVKALTAGTMAIGVNSIAGVLGFYWHSFDFTTTDSDGNLTPTIILSTKQAPKYTYTLPIVGEKTANASPTWTTDAANVLANWAVGDVISIVNDNKYAFCSTIKTIDSANGKITVDSLPFTESTASADTVLTKNFDDYTLFVPAKPTIGIVNLGFGAFALGYNNKAAGSFASTIGYENIAGSDFAFVTGKENKGSYASLVGGNGNITTSTGAFAAGSGNIVNGNYGTATGSKTIASGRCANAQNNTTIASGNDSSAEGWETEARGVQSHAGGAKTRAIGGRSFAGGYRTIALGADSFAMGYGTTVMEEISIDLSTASNDEIIAQWENTKFSLAKGIRSQVLGLNCLALAQYAFAHGCQNIAAGNQSYAEGNTTQALGSSDHAQGAGTIARGGASHAEGKETIAAGRYSHVQGKWNVEDSEDKYAHIVGGGSSDTDRKNIHTVDWNGNGWFPSLSLGGTCDNPKVNLTYNEDTGRLVISVK